MNCRFCGTSLEHRLVSLGFSPLSNSYLTEEGLHRMEPHYPLEVFVCSECLLVQIEEFESPEGIFSDYAYFSSFSRSWLDHARMYVSHMCQRFRYGDDSLVVEVASNDGYLLQYFRERGIPVLGIEPAANVAEAARRKGIETEVMFFGEDSAEGLLDRGKTADLIVGNNVLAHVPGLNDFVAGLKILLKPEGVITMEFPHLLELMRHVQFDTIYHEHFSYFSFLTVAKVFSSHGLRIFDVQKLPTHGGSLRIFACHDDNVALGEEPSVGDLLREESVAGLGDISGYEGFQQRVDSLKRGLLRFLIDAAESGSKVAAYGAPAKGNTLLNYCGVGPDLVLFTVDRNPEKQGKYLPGSRIPVMPVEEIDKERPDYILILPWNIKDEIISQMAHVGKWGGRFVVAVPEVILIEAKDDSRK